jgi:hypothetical protein
VKKLLWIAGALVFGCPARLLASPPTPPAALQPYIHDGRFDPGDYGWLRGLYPGATAADRANFESVNSWINTCIGSHRDRVRSELQGMGIANPTLDHLPASDPLCSGFASSPDPRLFRSYADLQQKAAEARPYADAYIFEFRTAEQQANRGGSFAQQLEGRAIADQIARVTWGDGPWRNAPSLSPGAKAILNARLGIGMAEVDRGNTEWLKAMIAERGWPAISKSGEAAAANAWLLVQHADADPAFQLKALRLMEPLLAKGDVNKSNYAYLYDRVMVNIGGEQRYGTQMTCHAGKLVPHLIEDQADLAKRRAAMGLQPMADYLKTMESLPSGCPNA